MKGSATILYLSLVLASVLPYSLEYVFYTSFRICLKILQSLYYMFQDMDVCTHYTYTQLYSYTHIIVDQTLHDMCTIELQRSTFRTPEFKKKQTSRQQPRTFKSCSLNFF